MNRRTREFVTDQHPGQQCAENGVGNRGDQRGAEGHRYAAIARAVVARSQNLDQEMRT